MYIHPEEPALSFETQLEGKIAQHEFLEAIKLAALEKEDLGTVKSMDRQQEFLWLHTMDTYFNPFLPSAKFGKLNNITDTVFLDDVFRDLPPEERNWIVTFSRFGDNRLIVGIYDVMGTPRIQVNMAFLKLGVVDPKTVNFGIQNANLLILASTLAVIYKLSGTR